MVTAARIVRHLPAPVRSLLSRHGELLRFAVVGGVCFVVTIVLNYALKWTILSDNPLTAQGLALLVAMILSYVLNREWSFRTRGGRQQRHEAALFFLISSIGVAINSAPLAVSRYVFQVQVPNVSLLTQEIADFASGIVLGTLIAMAFRWWAFTKWVFPEQNARTRSTVTTAGRSPNTERQHRPAA